jgi:tRNA-dihydrouridine synthase
MVSYNKDNLLKVVEQYLAITATSDTALGRAAVNDPHLVAGIRKGRRLRDSTAHAVLDHVISHLEQLTAQPGLQAGNGPSLEAGWYHHPCVVAASAQIIARAYA